MKYMSFNSSCTLTAVANMLELLDINDVTDRELAKRLNLPYIFRYKENQFCAGAMNQNASIYNYYLKEMGFEFVEEELDVINLLPYLKLHPISMLGIKSESGKHAVVFLKQEADELVFLNPHYENDGKEDFLQIKTNQLSKLLEKKIMVGRIQKCHSQKMKVDFEASLEGLDIYLKEFDAFCSK
ncbi:MAG: hypothetical protein K2K50_08380, partial [Anaeroplasmataceae bacterium]|nr:hypothetical protein [Anaeroplasmataceae bacterium]